jgi:hypothetical protein
VSMAPDPVPWCDVMTMSSIVAWSTEGGRWTNPH